MTAGSPKWIRLVLIFNLLYPRRAGSVNSPQSREIVCNVVKADIHNDFYVSRLANAVTGCTETVLPCHNCPAAQKLELRYCDA